MTNTYEFTNLEARDQKDYLAELTKLGINETPISYCYDDDLTGSDATIYEETSTVNGLDVVSVNGTLFIF